MMSRSTCLSSVLLSLLCWQLAQAASEKAELTAEQLRAHPEVKGALAAIDAWVDGVRTFERVPGISAGIVIDQDLVWDRGYGFSNLEAERPADADTIYSICSISKLFTSMGVMQLRDAGKLRLSDPVASHLPWYDIEETFEAAGPATIESLLTHSSGLPRESDFPYWNGPDFPFPTREQMIERLNSQHTLYPAQLNFQYSNLALSLAGEIVQAVSGTPYRKYVESNILAPLELRDTRPELDDHLGVERRLLDGEVGGEKSPFRRGCALARGGRIRPLHVCWHGAFTRPGPSGAFFWRSVV
jgi:CubicO group peptidase (beta-lactamase class C family)